MLSKRPKWYIALVHDLLCVDPGDRMGVHEAVHVMQSGGHSAATGPCLYDISKYLPALATGGPEWESAVAKIRTMVDGLKSRGDWDGVYRVLWQFRMESGIGHPDDFSLHARQLFEEVRVDITDHVLSNKDELERILKKLVSDGDMEAEIGTFLVWQACFDNRRARKAFIEAGALPGLVGLLGSSKGEEAECAAGTLRSIAFGSEDLKEAVVDAGALPGLVGLLGSRKGKEAECATGTLRSIVCGSEIRKQAVVDAGALPGLVVLLGSSKGEEAECAAGTLRSIAFGSEDLKQAVVDAGALPGLVVLLGSSND